MSADLGPVELYIVYLGIIVQVILRLAHVRTASF